MPKDFDLGTKGFDHGESHHGYSDNGDSLGHDPYRCPSKSSNPEAGDISEDKKRLYGLALAPVSTHTGYPYPCRQEDLDSYSLKKKKLTRFGDFLKDVAFYWPSNTDDAVREIEAFLDPERPPSAEEQSAVDRLCQVLCLENGEWTPDVPIKAFRDLDTVFFQRRLCGNVKVGWVSGEEMPPGTIGTTAYKFNGHSKIMLDADHYIFESEHPWRKMWRTLLHEMVHAYLYLFNKVMIGLTSVKDKNCVEDCHGPRFQKIMTAIQARSKRYLGFEACTESKYIIEHCETTVASEDDPLWLKSGQ